MKFYILDDVSSTIKILDKIITEKNLGEVTGYSSDPDRGIEEIIVRRPDIVLVDLLMPSKDGITVVNEVKKVCPEVKFIMISRVANKEMVAEAYNVGVEAFITKPINLIEVEAVIRNVARRCKLEDMISGFKDMLNEENISESTKEDYVIEEVQKSINYILGIIGILGESGTRDVQNICAKCITNKESDTDEMIKEYCESISETEKIVKQRVRRAIKKGLVNMAHLGIEDPYNEIFQNYAQLLFDYEALRKQISFIKGEGFEEGKINISSFIEGLLIYGYQQ